MNTKKEAETMEYKIPMTSDEVVKMSLQAATDVLNGKLTAPEGRAAAKLLDAGTKRKLADLKHYEQRGVKPPRDNFIERES